MPGSERFELLPAQNSSPTNEINNSSLSEERTNRNKFVCAICGDSSDGLHFGAMACRACAAFFRRSVARKLTYVCRFAKDCEFSKRSRGICRACRMAKCFAAGMNPRAVSSGYSYQPKRARHDGAIDTNASSSLLPLPPSRSPSPAATLPRPVPLRVAPKSVESSTTLLLNSNTNTCTAQKSSQASSSNNGGSVATKESRPEDRLRQLIERNANYDFSPFAGDLSPSLGALGRLLLGYERLQRHRDIQFGRVRDYSGTPSRVYLEKRELKYRCFYERVKIELDWVAEYLYCFDGYPQLDIADRMVLFKNYWVNFIVLERIFDTFRVLGADIDDERIVMQNGDIIDFESCQIDWQDTLERPERDGYRPWFYPAKAICRPLKKLAPNELEMAFCLGIILWKFPPDLAKKLSKEGQTLAEKMANVFYAELADYYQRMGPPPNSVARVAEMMRLIAYTEKVTLLRKEDAILAKTFKSFKIDLFLEEIFGPANEL